MDQRSFMALYVMIACIVVIVVVGLLNSCGTSATGPRAVNDEATCDTTDYASAFIDGELCFTRLIECTFTIFDTVLVEAEPDTIILPPDLDCVADCLEINGLGHWRECLAVCLPAQ